MAANQRIFNYLVKAQLGWAVINIANGGAFGFPIFLGGIFVVCIAEGFMIGRLLNLFRKSEPWPEFRYRYVPPEYERALRNAARDDTNAADTYYSFLRDCPDRSKAANAAMTLLREHLTEEQWEEYRLKGYFHVEVMGRCYRITRRWSDNVLRVGPDGRLLAAYCCNILLSFEFLPEADRMLAIKLWIENNPTHFFKTAVARPS